MSPFTPAPPRIEIGYAERTSQVAGVTSTTGVDVASPGVSVPVTFAAETAVIVEFGCALVTGPTNGEVPVLLVTDASNVELARTAAAIPVANGYAAPPDKARRIALAAGSHTLKLRALSTFGTSVTFQAGAKTPIWLRLLRATP